MTKWFSAFTCIVLIIRYADSCITPLGAQGECVKLNECNTFVSGTQMSNASLYYDFIRKSQCGLQGNMPLVCCGPLPIVDPVLSADSNPASVGSCGVNGISDKIYGGQDAELEDFPWMALLTYLDKALETLSFQCGGTLINQRYVLTAAHCVSGAIVEKYGKPIIARLGEHNITSNKDCIGVVCADPVQDIYIISIHPHEKYVSGDIDQHDDISLLRLAQRANINFSVKPICLIEKDKQLLPETAGYVAGWGSTLSASKSDVKQKLRLLIHDHQRCVELLKKSYIKTLPLTDGQICAGGTFREDACKGDSGGPLMIENSSGIWELVGVVSTGYGCGGDHVPGLYTDVSRYIDWIQTTLQNTNV